MPFYLYIMRHAKSDWSTGDIDFDRPLTKRGINNAARMGKWLATNNHVPGLIVCSSAVRARQTLEQVRDSFKAYPDDKIIHERRLYLADESLLLDKILLYRHAAESLMLIGHNPGLDYLVDRLANNALARNASGKLMTTAALAVFEYNDENFNPGEDKPNAMQLIRPRELD